MPRRALTAVPDPGPASVWWDLADRPALAPRPPLADDLRARTLIVGAGVAGLSLAVALARLGDDDIVVLDREHPGAGATGRNAGFLLVDSDCVSLAASLLGERAALDSHDVGLRTREFVASLEGTPLPGARRRFRIDRCGSLRLASDRGEARHLASTAAHGFGRLEDPAAAPEAGRARWLAALADDGDALLDPLDFVSALVAECDRLGVRRFDGTLVRDLRVTRRAAVAQTVGTVSQTVGTVGTSGTSRTSGTVRAVRTLPTFGVAAAGARDGPPPAPSSSAASSASRPATASSLRAAAVTADRVFICTNADARRLVPGALRVRPVRAQALAAWVDPVPPWHRPVYATRGGDYWRRLPDGRVLLGGMRRTDRRREATSARSPDRLVQRALDRLLRRLVAPGARIEVTHRWAGTMGFTPDGMPVAGAVLLGPLSATPIAAGAARAARAVGAVGAADVTGAGRAASAAGAAAAASAARAARAVPPRLHLLAGFNGHGMGWAPGLASLLAAQVQAGGPPVPTSFRPGRNLGRPSGRP